MLSTITKNSPQKQCLRIYYALLLMNLMFSKNDFYLKDTISLDSHWQWGVAWMAYLDLQSPLILLHTVACIAALVATLFPDKLFSRLLVSIMYFFALSARMSLGHIFIDSLYWLFGTFFLIFEFKQSPWTHFSIIRAFCLSTYFNSGIWKLRELLKADIDFNELSKIFPYDIAQTLATSEKASYAVMNFFNLYPTISAVVWLGVILFQLSTLAWLFIKNKEQIIGVLLLAFHLCTSAILSIDFNQQMLMLIFLFFILPYFSSKEMETKLPTL